MVQLIKAVELGYTIVHVNEVWHFPENQQHYGLFSDFMKQWLKIKQESVGHPSWVCNEDQTWYVQEHREWEQISLDLTMIQKNPGYKATAKLKLSFFWDKFRENLHKTHHFAAVSNPLTPPWLKRTQDVKHSQTEAELRLG